MKPSTEPRALLKETLGGELGKIQVALDDGLLDLDLTGSVVGCDRAKVARVLVRGSLASGDEVLAARDVLDDGSGSQQGTGETREREDECQLSS